MPPALYIARALNHSSPLLHIQIQYSVAVKRSDLSSRWFCLTSSALRPGWTWGPPPVQQRRFASNNKDQRSSNREKESSNKDKDKKFSKKDEEWYCWYARLGLHPDPKASVKDFRKAFFKRAKLQETFENLCDESKRKKHDQQRLARQKAAEAQVMASQPSVADILQAKWRAEDEAMRKREAEDMRTRETRKTAQGDQQCAESSSRPHEPGADSQKPQGSKPEGSKEAPRKQQQQQTKPEETEEDRLRKQKIADDLLAKKKAAAEEKKSRQDAAAEKTRQNNRSQERVIIIRGLPAGTELVDLFEPLIDLAPGPVFDAKLWSARIAAIEFCTDAAARRVLALAQQKRLYIKGKRMTTVQLTRSTNKIPVIGSGSRVVILNGVTGLEAYVNNEEVGHFLTRHGLRVERTVNPLWMPGSSIIRLASWADAEKASRLLAKHLLNLEINYGPDPCGKRKNLLHVNLGSLLRSLGFSDTERSREQTVEVVSALLVVLLLYLAYKHIPRWWKTTWRGTEDESKLPTTTGGVLNMGSDHV